MPSTEEYKVAIQALSGNELLHLWESIISENGETRGWEAGKAFEFLVLRAFEKEGAIIKWPFSASLFGESVEQIDGVVHFTNINLSVLTEFKDHATNLNIEPIAKLRNQLLRRPSNAIGSVFSTQGFTEPALILSQFSAPQTILLWERDHIDLCMRGGLSFTDGFLRKYRHAIETGFPNFDITI